MKVVLDAPLNARSPVSCIGLPAAAGATSSGSGVPDTSAAWTHAWTRFARVCARRCRS